MGDVREALRDGALRERDVAVGLTITRACLNDQMFLAVGPSRRFEFAWTEEAPHRRFRAVTVGAFVEGSSCPKRSKSPALSAARTLRMRGGSFVCPAARLSIPSV